MRRRPDNTPPLRIAPGTAAGEPDHQIERAAADERETSAINRLMRAIFGERFTLDPARLGRVKRKRR